MNYFHAVILGVVQGLSEFLPISSTGHLVLVQSILPGFDQPGVLFDVVLHLGTTLAVLAYFRYEILRMGLQDIKYIIIGSIPAGIVGILFQAIIEDLFLSTFFVGLGLFLTAAMNFFTDRAKAKRERTTLSDAIVVGIGQAIAILPGVSRSGITIFMGTTMGLDRAKAAQFSFLLSTPAILGASVLQLISHADTNTLPLGYYAIGFVTAFIVGIIAIFLVFRLLTQKKFTYFAIYCVIAGIIALLM